MYSMVIDMGVKTLVGMALAVGVTVIAKQTVSSVAALTTPPENPHLHIPRILEGVKSIYDSLLTLSEYQYADIARLERVGRRCATLLETYMKVSGSEPGLVKPSIITLGARYNDAVKTHLLKFYHASGILLVMVDGQMQPANDELKHAHDMLLMTVEGLADMVELAAREKLEEAVADKLV